MNAAGVAALALVFTAGCASPGPTTHTVRVRASAALERGEPTADPLRFVPSDTTSLVKVDLARARRDSPYYSDFIRWLEVLRPFGRGGEEALIGVLEHTELLYVTIDAYRGHTEPRCLILSGDYEPGEVEAAARKTLNQVVVANSFRDEDSERRTVVFGANTLVQLDDDYTWIFCASRVLSDALDARDTATLLDDRTPSIHGIDSLAARPEMIAMVGLGAPGTREFPLEYRATIDARAESIRGFSWGLDLDSGGFTLEGSVYTRDEATVGAMRELLPSLFRDLLMATPLGVALSEEPEEPALHMSHQRSIGLLLEYRLDASATARLMARLNALVLLSQEATRSD